MLAAARLSGAQSQSNESLEKPESEEDVSKVIQRLMDVNINKPSTSEATDETKKPVTAQTSSTSRPLTVDDDEIDLDLEIDENLDVSVSYISPPTHFKHNKPIRQFQLVLNFESMVPNPAIIRFIHYSLTLTWSLFK
jgi:hypothetical protein